MLSEGLAHDGWSLVNLDPGSGSDSWPKKVVKETNQLVTNKQRESRGHELNVSFCLPGIPSFPLSEFWWMCHIYQKYREGSHSRSEDAMISPLG